MKMVGSRRLIWGSSAFVLLGLISVVLGACSEGVDRLSESEERLGVHTTGWGADSRKFHHVLHYSNAVGPRFDGYIVGLEKSNQSTIGGPRVRPELLKPREIGDPLSSARDNLSTDLRTHFLSHIVNYWAGPGRYDGFPQMQNCVNYSAIEHSKTELQTKVFGRNAALDSDVLKLFKECHPGREQIIGDAEVRNVFDKSWDGLAFFKGDLESALRDKYGQEKPYSHIFLIVMGWNTPQSEAVQNYNSIVGHFLEVMDKKRLILANEWAAIDCEKAENATNCAEIFKKRCDEHNAPAECKFRPLLIGVTWASNWEVSPLIPLPSALVRLASFPNKASDAEEVGVTWLNTLIQNVVLPARNSKDTGNPKITLIGHSFGARAMMAALSQPTAISQSADSKKRLGELKAITEFNDGDSFISLEGAFEVKKLFEKDDISDELNKTLVAKKLRTILVASQYDEAVRIAFWDTYAGGIDGFNRLCVDQRNKTLGKIDCDVIQTHLDKNNKAPRRLEWN